MKKTTNTANEPKIDWLFGGNPNAILAQESAGQKELVASQQLPKKCNDRGINAAEQYHKMGIKVFTSSKGDDLFLGVALPDGWKKEATDHSMWNKLVDNKGRTRATFFYKAAFYDRNAFINFETRYQIETEFFDDEKNPKRDWHNLRIIHIKDTSINENIWSSKKHFYEDNDKMRNAAKDWLNKNYSDWKNINAYWD